MRLRIIIDTDDARFTPEQPFRLTVFTDDDSGTPSYIPLYIDQQPEDFELVGDDIAVMLERLRRAFADRTVQDLFDRALPCTADQWQAYEQRRAADR